MTGWKPPGPGALDDTAWPEQLPARAVHRAPDDDRLHGYAVLGDLANHYRYSDVVYLAIVGELPDPDASEVFHLALCSFATISVGEAPAHLAVLSRLSGGTLSSALGAGMIAVANQANQVVAAHAALLEWLASPAATVPPEFCSDTDRRWIQTLCDAIANANVRANSLVRGEMTRDAARIALLYLAGLRSADQMEAAIVASRFCGIAAETLATGPQHLGEYPVKVPPFHYEEG